MPSPTLIWFFLGAGFLMAELVVPGFILIFFTMGCWIAALFSAFTNVSTAAQIIIFIISSLSLLVGLRRYFIKTFKGETQTDMDDDYAKMKIGKTALVTQEIKPHSTGEIKVMGSFWRAISDEEIKEGESVRIESQASEDGLTFKVGKIGDKNE